MFKRIILLGTLILALPLSVNAQTLSQFYGGHLPSLQYRKQIADVAGIKNYVGTAPQNNKLVSFLLEETKPIQFLGATPSEPTNTNQGYNPPTGYQSILTSYIAGNATTIPVVSTKDLAGNAINLANLSQASVVKVYMTVEPGNPTSQEEVVCTGVTSQSWTNCTRGLPFQGGSETASTTLQKSHNAGASVIITNISQFYNQYLSVDGTQVVNGIKTFNVFPVTSSTTALPVNNNQFVNKYYVDQQIAGGFSCASASSSLGIQCSGSPAQFGINASSTTGLGFDNSGALYQKVSSTKALAEDSNGIYVETTSTLKFDSSGNLGVMAFTTPTANGIPLADASGTIRQWDYGFVGDGTNGALNVLSGTTTVSVSGQNILTENYTSFNVASSSVLNFSTPSTTGTIVLIKVQGDCTVSGTINLVGMGATSTFTGYGMADDAVHVGSQGTNGSGGGGANAGGAGGLIFANHFLYAQQFSGNLYHRFLAVGAGSGGGKGGLGYNGGGTAGIGGIGGGGIILQCGGTLNYTGSVILSGSVGSNGATGGGGGGGGSAGMGLFLANRIGVNTGTTIAKGGAGGNGGSGSGGSSVSGGGGGGGGGCYISAGQTGGNAGSAGSSGSNGSQAATCEGSSGGGGGGNNGSTTGGTGGAAGAATDPSSFAVLLNTIF